MEPRLDDNTTPADANPSAKALSRFSTRAKRPTFEDKPRRRLPPMVLAAIGGVIMLLLLYGGQALLPGPFKPASWVSAYDSQLLEARKTGELNAQIRYEAQLRSVELQHQGQLKQIETAAIQWQEQFKTVLNAYNEDYRASYQRANIYAQATADMQKQYAGYRLAVTQGTLGGEMSVANTATMFGLIGGLFSPEFESASLEFAEKARQQALSKLDAAARGGVTVSIEGWDTGLPHPDELARRVYDLPPLQLPGFAPMPITVPAAAPTAQQ